jgi:hypothetical protein
MAGKAMWSAPMPTLLLARPVTTLDQVSSGRHAVTWNSGFAAMSFGTSGIAGRDALA